MAGPRALPAPGRGVAHPALFFALAALSATWLAFPGGTACAHFLLNVNIRIFHVVHEPDRIRLLVRLPMPWLVADKLGPETAAGSRAPAPYTINRMEDGALARYLDADTLRNAPEGLAGILADGLVLTTVGETLRAEIGRVRAWPAREQTPFTRLDEAEATLAGPVYPDGFEATYAGDTIVDVELIYPTGGKPPPTRFKAPWTPDFPTRTRPPT